VILTAESSDAIADSVRDRLFLHHEVPSIGRELAGLAWQLNVPGSVELDRDVDFTALAESYALTGRGIQNAVNLAVRTTPPGAPVAQPTLEAAARAQQSSGLGEFARRTWVSRVRADLVAPARVAKGVDDIIATERVRETVIQQWGLAARMHKGLGLVCLFDGEPGTGKTLAAEVIASELSLPLYTVNVANIVSKWIGETEKNLQRIFDDAQRNRCVLLFDEADSLFAKRTDVTRSVDRYANMEVGLLLQLVEAYRGLVILTTNLKETLDPAFSRRFAHKITFEFPDANSRREIWARLLPAAQLAPDLDIDDVAWSYELAGGSIRTVVLRAAFRAAIEGSRITREIVGQCAVEECRALGKLVRDPAAADDASGWSRGR
jgi:SpoVK/Ycf46/Vps4 family AAA+-type ATPase